LLDIGVGGGDNNDDDNCNDSDNSYGHNYHPSAFELSSLSSIFQVKFYRHWPANADFWFEPGYLLNSAHTSAKTVVTILGMIVRYWQADGTYGCH